MDPGKEGVVVQIDTVAAFRSLPAAIRGFLRAWVISSVGEDTWERTVSLTIGQDGAITISRYAVDEDGYVLDPTTRLALQEQVTFQAAAPFPIHIIGPIGVPRG